MIPRFVIVIILFVGWLPSCKQSRQDSGKLIPGDMKSAIALLNDTSTARVSIWKDTAGMGVKVFGKYWFNNINGKAPVKIILNDDTVKVTDIKYNINGSFLADLPRLYLIKTYILKVAQQNEKGEQKEATIEFKISSVEKE